MPTPTLHVTGVAVGGDGLARDPDGRVVLVAGALPGEVVHADVVASRRDHARAVTLDVVEAAPERVAPPCPLVAAGCGGCGWQHVDVAAQRRLKAEMVADALRRLGGVEDPAVDPGPELAPTGYRTSLRGVADAGGRFALRRPRSHEPVAVPGCLVAHPLVVDVVDHGRFPPGAEITIRAGARTGERLVVVDVPGSAAVPGRSDVPGSAAVPGGSDVPGSAAVPGGSDVPGSGGTSARPGGSGLAGGSGGSDLPVPDASASPRSAALAGGSDAPVPAGGPGGSGDAAAVVVPEGVRVVGGDELAAGRRAWLHEEVAGRRFRVSARSFFQPRPDGAEALVEAVAAAVGDPPPGEPHLVDLYGGVGLFAATVGAGWRVTLVEASASAAADARVNLASAPADAVASARVERAPAPADTGSRVNPATPPGGDDADARNGGDAAADGRPGGDDGRPGGDEAADARPADVRNGGQGAGNRTGAGRRRARVVRADVRRWRPRRADAVVADPPRAGLGRAGVRAVAGTGAARLVLVSCDAGALGRDAALLAAAGYRFVGATLVDQFVGTPHVEVVSRFERS